MQHRFRIFAIVGFLSGCQGEVVSPDPCAKQGECPPQKQQEQERSAVISGRVRLQYAEEHADVAVSVGGRSTQTGADGSFRFEDIAPGERTVSASKAGYINANKTLSLQAGQTITIQLTLGRDPELNAPPEIESVNLTPNAPLPGSTATATVTASDPDGDALAFSWQITGGFNVEATGSSVSVEVPRTPGAQAELSVTAWDPFATSASQTLQLTASDQPPADNTAPTLTLEATRTSVDPTASPLPTIGLTADATDPESDRLSFKWAVDDPEWTLVPSGATATLTPVAAFGATVDVSVTAEDALGAQTSETLSIATEPCAAPDTLDCDGDASNGCEAIDSGLGAACPAPDCNAIVGSAYDRGDGTYWIDPNGGEPSDSFRAYCDMGTLGGGWTLLGTISGGDAERWNTEFGAWANDAVVGAVSSPWDDYKSRAWNELDLSGGTLLYQRRYDGIVVSQALLATECMADATAFADLFQSSPEETTRACRPADILVLEHGRAGLPDPSFEEGVGSRGLGNANTNGLCWTGGDSQITAFKGHVVWGPPPESGIADADACYYPEHDGGIGVFETDADLDAEDIAATDWMYFGLSGGDDARELTDISFFGRGPPELVGDFDAAEPGRWAGDVYAASCARYASFGATQDGIYRIDPDGAAGAVAPFNVECDMSSDGGGWMLLAYEEAGDSRADSIIVAENSRDNPWYKCDDDSAQYFDWIDNEQSVLPDSSQGDLIQTVQYRNVHTGELLTSAQLAALRQVVVELHPSSRMVAVISDNDDGDLQDGGDRGHEVYIKSAAGGWSLLSSGANGDCGGGPGDWPANGSESGYYLVNSAVAVSETDGDTGGVSELDGVAPEDILPTQVRIDIDTGGGAAFGFMQRELKVR